MHMGQIESCFRRVLTQKQIHQIIVRQRQQPGQRIDFFIREVRFVRIKKTRQYQVIFQQTAAAAPSQPCAFCGIILMLRSFHHTARRTSSSLILPIALFGFRPLGQTSTQFMIEWQRNSR